MAIEDPINRASEMVKKVLTAGVGAVFMSEEALRNLVSEIKLPKELIGGILETANAARKEFFQGLTSQVVDKISSHLDVQAAFQEFLSKNDIEIQMKIRFSARDGKESKVTATTQAASPPATPPSAPKSPFRE